MIPGRSPSSSNWRQLLIPVVAALLLACSDAPRTASNSGEPPPDERATRLKRQKDAIAKFFKPMRVEAGDWLESQNEPGETFEEYLSSAPTRPTPERRTLYIQPIGEFNAKQKRVIDLTAEHMRVFYSLPVTLSRPIPLGRVPAEKQRRIGRGNRQLQIRTGYFLDDVLPGILPKDAAALIAFTNHDLYPEETWHYVFGQASLQKRIGVWSLYRLADGGEERLLMRTLKIAMHETGHMFSMKHCTKYECLMSGTNHLAETDRRPVDNCPECMAKLAWAMNYDPGERYRRLATFWMKLKRKDLETEFLQKAEAVANT